MIGIAIVVLAATAIGAANIFAVLLFGQGLNAQSLLAIRFFAFALLCLGWLRLCRQSIRLPAGRGWTIIGVGIAYAVGSGSLLMGFRHLPVSLVVLIFYAYPLLTMAAVHGLDKVRPPLTLAACFAAAFCGLAVALDVSLSGVNAQGLFWAGLAAVGMTVAYVWSGRKLTDVPPETATFYYAVVGGFAAFGLATIGGTWQLPNANLLTAGLLAAAIASFATAFLGMFTGIRWIGPSQTAMIMNLEPVVTIVLSVLVLEEFVSQQRMVGAVLVIGAVVAAQIQALRRAEVRRCPWQQMALIGGRSAEVCVSGDCGRALLVHAGVGFFLLAV